MCRLLDCTEMPFGFVIYIKHNYTLSCDKWRKINFVFLTGNYLECKMSYGIARICEWFVFLHLWIVQFANSESRFQCNSVFCVHKSSKETLLAEKPWQFLPLCSVQREQGHHGRHQCAFKVPQVWMLYAYFVKSDRTNKNCSSGLSYVP